MTVTAQTPYNTYTAAPGATVFSSAFRVIQPSDLVVKINGTTQTSGFTVSGLGAAGGVDVTFTTPMTGGEKVELLREIPLTRATDYQQLGDFLAPVVNLDFDRQWQAAQGIALRLGGALRLPYPEQAAELPAASDRAGKLLSFDDLGRPRVSLPAFGSAEELADDLAEDTGSSLVGYDGGTVLTALNSAKALGSIAQLRAYSGTATTIRISETGFVAVFRNRGVVPGWNDNGITVFKDALNRNWQRVYEGPVYPEWAGAVGDGIADDSAAIQAWLFLGGNLALGFRKTYRLANTTPLAFAGDTTIQGNGSTFLVDRDVLVGGKPDKSNGALTLNGAGLVGSDVGITEAVEKHSNVLKVSNASSFAAGDLIRITSTEYFHGAKYGSGPFIGSDLPGYFVKTKGELSSIRSVDYLNNTIVLAEKTKDSYSLAYSPVVRKRQVTKNVYLENVQFKNRYGYAYTHTDSMPTGSRAFTATDVEDLVFNNVSFANFPEFAVVLTRCRNVIFGGSSFEGYDLNDPTNVVPPEFERVSVRFTGVVPFSCENISFINNFSKNTRAACSPNSTLGDAISRNIVISGNTAVNCLHTASAQCCENVVISGNTGISSGGINFRGKNAVISSNALSLATSTSFGINIGHNASPRQSYTEQASAGHISIIGNTVNGICLNGITAYTDVDSLTISDNKIATAQETAVYLVGKRTQNVSITNNIFKVALDGIYNRTIWIPNFAINTTPGDGLGTIPKEILRNVTITGNTFLGSNYAAIGISGSSSSYPTTNIRVTDNNFDQSSVKYTVGFTGDVPSAIRDLTGSFDSARIVVDRNFYPAATPELGNVYGPA